MVAIALNLGRGCQIGLDRQALRGCERLMPSADGVLQLINVKVADMLLAWTEDLLFCIGPESIPGFTHTNHRETPKACCRS